jgi:hypothetical protein
VGNVSYLLVQYHLPGWLGQVFSSVCEKTSPFLMG